MDIWVQITEKAMAPHSSTLAWKIHEQRSLVGCSPWGLEESGTTSLSLSLAHIREGNGNPLQCSCLENPRDGGVWWAAVYGVAQSRTQLKRLSSSSSSNNGFTVHSKLAQHCKSTTLEYKTQITVKKTETSV